MAQNNKKNKQNLIVGIVVIVLALVGFVNIIGSCVKTVSGLFDNSEKLEEYKSFIAPVIMNDPSSFDDVTNADVKQLISIAMWSLLSSDIDPDSFEYTDSGMLVEKTMVEQEYIRLFGTDATITHQTVDGGGIEFEYNSKKGAYVVPITGVSAVYTPVITDVNERGSTIILTVGCLAGTDWTQDKNGDMIPPEPAKYVRIYLRENGDSYYISSIKDVDSLEVITTEATTEETTKESETKKSEKTTKS